MYAVASLLNPAADKQTRDLWRLLENRCGLSGISMPSLPHFSWQAASEYDASSANLVIFIRPSYGYPTSPLLIKIYTQLTFLAP
jgi:hypothetical protein